MTGALDVNGGGVVKQAIEEGRGDHRIAKDLAPLGEAALDVRIMAPFS